MTLSKTKTSFYRRLLLAYLVDSGINTLPKIQAEINIPRRTAQDTITALQELDIECTFVGALKNGHYQIESWGPFDKNWVNENIERIRETLSY
ncbi:helix-turn-helix domain-containing protein [Vibrio parahaemolyticus]|uniref:helix-turn-helix domain-containing protein n=1 Tax=Vibrio parahaemolyticus TaxID=670 RepID=UPI0011216ABE|nr:helix-turn-helix domain-containing protein [Vibrio parahaemolyticus]EHQ9271119.1 helix-turn-helix domain-containing protein [Vibrio parahaemolyticus]EKB7281804.1 helix-turn-helix domain-containing protein [Vibrio parahaemolyticus]ELB2920160.1 helix-turn-helix domain-containing protein [Vibrio parahaemolyticus]MCR9851537.1 winged helix-turn-helix domain-containing protein [Vibrio parahaemolyticus]MCX8799675.1 winged helix-turn-helix domain-containing protein [Vibrio parahaemolyticus]